jgi:hypothetical protein
MIVLRSPILRQVHAYWDRKRGQRAAPLRQDIDPGEITRLLPHLFMIDVVIDVVGDPARFRYRLIGTGVVELTGRDLTGRFVDESLEKEKLAALVEPYQTVVAQRRPVAKKGRTIWIEKRESLEVEVLLLPIANPTTVIDIIFGSVVRLGEKRPPRREPDERIEYGDLAWGTDFAFADAEPTPKSPSTG